MQRKSSTSSKKRLESTWPGNQLPHFLNYLRIECGLADNTIMAYERDLTRFSQYCRKQKCHDPSHVSLLFLQGFTKSLVEQHLSTSTIARHVSAVKMFLKYHVLSGNLKDDICAELDSPKTMQKLPRVLDKKRTLNLLTSLDEKDPYYVRDRALLELLYATGMRASEVSNITVGDLNFQIGYLRCIGKGQKERIIPINKTALALLKTYLDDLRPSLLKKKPTKNVFLSRTGEALNRIEVWRIVQRAAKQAGLVGKVTPHTLRHCFGSHLLQGGADLRSVQEMLGHADVSTTQIYTHVDQEHLRAVHKQFHPRG